MPKISGFSKLTKADKIAWLAKYFFTSNPIDVAREFASFAHSNKKTQQVFDGLSENTLTNFYLPYGVAPNFMVNGRIYCVPMVIEESSVVAAAASGAKFWSDKGGFHAEVLSTTKVGQVHFRWEGTEPELFEKFFEPLKSDLREGVTHLMRNMEQRGGGISSVELINCNHIEKGLWQIKAEFETCDAMGANLINSVLEEFGRILMDAAKKHTAFIGREKEVEVIMSILSNYTPDCRVRAWVECPIEELGTFSGNLSASGFAQKFVTAVRIAEEDPSRATTHNKGIFNGIDAVILATGNDFRAVEACGHTYASKDGQYRSLSHAEIKDGKFRFWIDIPLAVGTVGGLTTLHPLAKRSMELLGNPSAEELMQIIATVGLAQNFAAVKSLVTTGIQFGHMRMHLTNILNHFGADETEMEKAIAYFSDKAISFGSVRDYLSGLRKRSTDTETNPATN
ncbi:MAG: hydroxymethylglutaryl-CoA reductase [Limisphaerales bacterium]|jgi:hydroxymethylglutaryl-CoA reductase